MRLKQNLPREASFFLTLEEYWGKIQAVLN